MSDDFLTLEEIEPGKIYKTDDPIHAYAFVLNTNPEFDEVACRFINIRDGALSNHYYGDYTELAESRFTEIQDFPVISADSSITKFKGHYIKIADHKVDLYALGDSIFDSIGVHANSKAYGFKYKLSIGYSSEHNFDLIIPTITHSSIFNILDKVSSMVDNKDYIFFKRVSKGPSRFVPDVVGIDFYFKEECLSNLIRLTYQK